MDDISIRLDEALTAFQEVAEAVGVDEALTEIDDTTLQLFWRQWPDVSGWAGALWRRLNADLERPATEVQDPDLDEVGGPG